MRISACLAGVLAAVLCHAGARADVAPLYGTAPGYGQAQVAGIVVLCASTDGSVTAKACNTLTAASVQGQAVVPVAGTAVQLPGSGIVNGFNVCALDTNTGVITMGGAGVTNAINGTGNGVVRRPGECWPFALTDTSGVWINATVSGDGVFFGGN